MIRIRSDRCCNSAFTLLEVILALAILAGAIVVLGEVMSIAGRNASDAQAEAEAQILATSIMDEMLSGMTDLTNLTRQAMESDSAIPWVCSVTISNTNLTGLTEVEVLVEQDVEAQFRPVKYRLVRWLSEASVSAQDDGQVDDAGASDDA